MDLREGEHVGRRRWQRRVDRRGQAVGHATRCLYRTNRVLSRRPRMNGGQALEAFATGDVSLPGNAAQKIVGASPDGHAIAETALPRAARSPRTISEGGQTVRPPSSWSHPETALSTEDCVSQAAERGHQGEGRGEGGGSTLFAEAGLSNERAAARATELRRKGRIDGVNRDGYAEFRKVDERRIGEWRRSVDPAVPARWVELAAVLTILIERVPADSSKRGELADMAVWRDLHARAKNSRLIETPAGGGADPGRPTIGILVAEVREAKLLRDEQVRDRLAMERVLAVEMEAAGVATAAHSHGVEWFAVHGVGDLAGIQKIDENWIPYAPTVAARFVCGALEFCRPFAEGGRGVRCPRSG